MVINKNNSKHRSTQRYYFPLFAIAQRPQYRRFSSAMFASSDTKRNLSRKFIDGAIRSLRFATVKNFHLRMQRGPNATDAVPPCVACPRPELLSSIVPPVSPSRRFLLSNVSPPSATRTQRAVLQVFARLIKIVVESTSSRCKSNLCFN